MARWKAVTQAARRFGVTDYRAEWLYDPPLRPVAFGSFDSATLESVEANVAAQTNAKRVGVRVEVFTRLGVVAKSVWTRNVQSAGITPHLIAENAAMMLAFRSAVAWMGEYFEPSKGDTGP